MLQRFSSQLMRHPTVPERQPMIFGDDALARARHHDRDRETLGQALDRAGSLPCAATREDQRATRHHHLSGRAADLCDGQGTRLASPRPEGMFDGGLVRVCAEQIHGQVDVAGAGSPSLETTEGIVHSRPDVRGARRPDTPLRDRSEHVIAVTKLMEILAIDAGRPAVKLAREQEHRRRIRVRFSNRGEGIGHARPWHRETDARPPGRSRVAVGHVAGATLVAGGHETDRRLVYQRVIDREVVDAWHAEDGVHPVGLQRPDQQLCAGRHRALF